MQVLPKGNPQQTTTANMLLLTQLLHVYDHSTKWQQSKTNFLHVLSRLYNPKMRFWITYIKKIAIHSCQVHCAFKTKVYLRAMCWASLAARYDFPVPERPLSTRRLLSTSSETYCCSKDFGTRVSHTSKSTLSVRQSTADQQHTACSHDSTNSCSSYNNK